MKKVGKILALSSLLLTAMMVAPLLTQDASNNGLNEQALDFGVNGSGLNFVHGQVFGRDEAVEVSKTFVQYGVTTYEGNEINVLRFATAVKGSIESLTYSRDHIDGLDDVSLDVSTVYRSLNANGKSVYYDPSASSNGLTADPTYANNYYWACYIVRFVSGDTYKDTDFTVRLSVNGEEKSSVTRNLEEVIQSSTTCSHDLTHTPAVPATRHVNGNLGYYSCSECSKIYEDADALVETTLEDRIDVSEGWTRFVPGFEATDSAFKTEETTLNGYGANRITIAAGTQAGKSGNFKPNNNSTYNTRTNLRNGVDTKFSMTVKNESNFAIDFRYFFDNYGDKGGHDMHLEANETKTFDFVVNFDTPTPGPWHGITVNNDLAEEAKLVINGEYTTDGAVDGETTNIEKYHDANKVRFVVGDTFTSEGLKVKLVGGVNNNVDWGRVESFETNFDGHTFTSEDVGTKTVEVKFGGASLTYTIEVAPPHVHEMIHTEAKPATYNMDGTLGYYTCSTCGLIYEDAEGHNETTVQARTDYSDAWFKFAPRNEVSTSASGVTSVYENIDEKIFNDGTTYATRVSFANEVEANKEINFCTGNSTQYGVNNRVPMHSGKQLGVKLFVKNHSSNSLSFNYRLNDNDGNSAVRVDLAAGEEKVIETTLSLNASTPGGWNRMIPVENIPAGSSFSIYGYIKTRGYQDFDGNTNSIKILKEATQKSFIVGEKFNANGMIVSHKEASYETYVNAGTNFDGHTFTAADIGTHTVEVKFASAVTTYQIEVTSGHTLNYVEAREATNWSNGSAAHYECTECGKLFSDAGAQNEIPLDSIKTSKGAWAHFTNYKGINGDVASAEYVNVNDKIFDENTIVRATKVRLNKDLNAGGQIDHQNNFDDPAVADRTNTRIPFVPGQTLDLKFYYENTGTSAISFKYRLWDGQSSTEIIEFSLQPGESTVISVTFTNPANLNNEGGWARFIAQSNIASGAEFISYAFYSTTNHGIFDFTGTGTGHKASLGIKQNASKTTFKVGETFTTDDLVLLLKNSLPNQKHGGILLFHFDTNFDNHVFTNDDIGTHQVVVRFADAKVTYNISVEA